MGAHGLGYGMSSLSELQHKISPSDIPALLELHIRSDLRTGTEFALASQCGSAIGPVRESALARKIGFLDAEDILTLIKAFPGCSHEEQEWADSTKTELHDRWKAEIARTNGLMKK
jgi:hypothetical protein